MIRGRGDVPFDPDLDDCEFPVKSRASLGLAPVDGAGMDARFWSAARELAGIFQRAEVPCIVDGVQPKSGEAMFLLLADELVWKCLGFWDRYVFFWVGVRRLLEVRAAVLVWTGEVDSDSASVGVGKKFVDDLHAGLWALDVSAFAGVLRTLFDVLKRNGLINSKTKLQSPRKRG